MVVLIHHVVINLDVIVRHFHTLVDSEVDLRCKTKLKLECKILLSVEIHLIGIGNHRLTEHVELIVANVVHKCIVDLAVYNLYENFLAIFLLKQSGRHMTRAESLFGIAHTYLLQFLLYFTLIICFCKRYCDNSIHIID